MKMREDRFTQNLTISLIGHIVLLAFFTVKAILFPSQPIIFEEALRVDLIALPDKIEAPPTPVPTPAPAPEKVEVAVKPEVPKPKPPPPKQDLTKQKTKQLDALRKLEMQAALDRLNKVTNKAEPKPTPALTKVEYKGNVISPGTSLTGVQKLEQDQYLGLVKQHISKNWFLPEWLAKSELKARVHIKIDENGSLLNYEIEKSSGNEEFDKLVLNTVKQSHPLPKPPSKFVDIVAVSGVVLGFPE